MGKKLYVRNLGFNTDSLVLGKIFSKYGTVESAKVFKTRPTGCARGIVKMNKIAAADAAMMALDGKEVGGQTLKVNEKVKPWAKQGKVVNLRGPGSDLTEKKKSVLVKSGGIQIIQLLIPAGENLADYQAQGEIVLHCLAGQVDIITDQSHRLRTGQLLHLAMNSPFTIQGIKNSSLLATIILPNQGRSVELAGG